MKKISWKEEYSVGVEKFDLQHQKLFEITNKIIEHFCTPDSADFVSETLKEMIDYAREHFTDEEVLMRKYGYPEIESQEKQHDYFINTTAELAISFMDNKCSTAGEIGEFLTLWLVNHILKSDMRYKEFFKAKIPAEQALSL